MKKNGNDPKVKSTKRGKNVPKAPKQRKSKGKNHTYSDNGLPKMSSTSEIRRKASKSTPKRYSPMGDWQVMHDGSTRPTKPASQRTEPRPMLDTFDKKKK